MRAMLLWLLVLTAPLARALTPQQALAIVNGDTDARIAAMQQAVQQPDAAVAALLQALAEDAVKTSGGTVYLVRDGQARDATTGAVASLPVDAEEVISNNRMRGEIDAALATLKLFSSDVGQRLEAARALQKEPDQAKLPLLARATAAETNVDVRAQLELARAAVQLSADSKELRLQAARTLATSHSADVKLLLNQRLSNEPDSDVRFTITQALTRIEDSLRWGERLAALFTGFSLASILLLAALGLAITYGLMGVINMAHGELIMIGAYATYVVQGWFQRWAPGAFAWYLVAAVPVSFLASALVGAVLERGVLRFLYGRPLETLLATWGISLMLMQAVRSVFGAQNVGVENPSWMSGGVQVLENLQLPWNRIIILGFALGVLLLMVWLVAGTRLGLFVRAVTQNRPIATTMGVNTGRIDTYAFALGSGIAGLAGCALSQIGNVGPDLGQNYIVDSFMVVVLGGVGQLVGTVVAALGLGILGKFLEGWAGAVLAKIAVLVVIVIFIQKRPQGLFALKGRSVE